MKAKKKKSVSNEKIQERRYRLEMSQLKKEYRPGNTAQKPQ
jgi:hypothetical protein